MASSTSASCAGSALSSIAQAPFEARIVVVPEAAATTVAAAVAAVRRNSRRFRMRLLIFVPPGSSAVAAVPLQDLDPVAVRVLDEEEARHQAAVAVKLLDRLRGDAGLGQAPVLAVEIVHAEGDVPVAVTVRVRLGAAVVRGQLDLEIGLGVAQVDQGEAVELEPVRDLQAKGGAVERDRLVEVEDADHHVDGFGHAEGLPASFREANWPI